LRTAPAADELFQREQLRRRIVAAVAALDEPFRTAVWLRWFEDRPVAAIASATGAPVDTVRSRLRRGVARVRADLDRDYGDRRWSAFAIPLGGGLLVKKLALASAMLVALGSIWWLRWNAAGTAAPPPDPPSSSTAVVSAPADRAPERDPIAIGVAEPANAPSPAPTPTPPYRDPTEAELRPFAADEPPGVIAGIVLQGLDPVRGGRAFACAQDAGGLPWDGPEVWDAAANVHRVAIADDGTFRFEALAAGEYEVGIATVGGAVRRFRVVLPAAHGTQRCRVVLGQATVRGQVFGPAGRIAPGWQVAIWNHGRMLTGLQFVGSTTADAVGHFEFTALCGGTYSLRAAPAADFADRTADVGVELGAGEVREVVLGVPATAGEWRGRVLLPDGTPLAVAMRVGVELVADGIGSMHEVGDGGAFAVRVAPREYSVSVRFATGARVAFGTIALGPGAIERDLELPAVVRVRPVAIGGGALDRGAVQKAWLSAVSGFRHEAVHARDGALCFFGVPAGDYRLQCWPGKVAGAPPPGTEIAVPAAGLTELDVPIERQ
ncbi:MAG: hypothetical protein KDE27_25350, partial [Planctomycetes bacterium]|nr:hypothetical protein [Planctomycetota bacterium]